MNLLRKGIFALLITGLIVSSCEDDDTIVAPNEGDGGTGLTEITFPSHAITVKIEDGDGTIVTVRPQGLGVTSYVVDFGDPNSTDDVITITEDAGTATYDYPNNVEEETYTITVTAKSNQGFPDVVQTRNVTVEHKLTTLSSSPSSPTILDENVYAVFSDGIEIDGAFTAYTNKLSGANFDSDDAEYNEVEVGDIKNKVIQYSRLHNTIAASITFDPVIVIADVFGTGSSADYLHMDLHSIHEIGIDKVKITMGGKTFEQTLESDTWTGIDIDFAAEGITQIDEITLELATGGTANNEATLNVDNIYLYREPLSVPDFTFDDVASDFDVTFTDASLLATSYSWDFGDGIGSSTDANPTYSYTDDGMERTYMVTLTTTNFINKPTSITKEVTVGGPAGPINPEILWGDFNGSSGDVYPPWKIANTPGNSNPFSGSSDGSCTEYDGTETGSKTRGAKWSSGNSADDINGAADPDDTRYAYQAVTLSPNTDYIFEFEYAIKTGGAETNSVVAAILNGHYSDSDVALASNPLVEHIGTEAKGKFADNSCSGGTTVKLQFRSNSVGEVSIFIYAFTDVDAFVDNVKVYPVE
ncbi:PKD domain-containing protein [uncultured Algibacter sp.]|uniref:PKD domain-containing protein n=1 Tax=uncultured Algibacter sp. TaxID=298659 RepID=UPI0026141F5C|nr:PKD domain-containing protein [uncultured Algibacter sp.]